MKETELWRQLQPHFASIGLPIRMENTASVSIPDVALICDSTTIWIELKLVKGKWITMPKFQFAFGTKLARLVHHDLFWILAAHEGNLLGFKYVHIIPHVVTRTQDTVGFHYDKVHYIKIYDVLGWVTSIINPLSGEQDHDC